MNKNQPAPFQWGEIELSQAVFVNNVPHVTRTAMGQWLEYADPQKAIVKILERNPHIEHYSTTVNMTAGDGKNRDTKVYNPIGFMLTVMESGQPKATAMKVAVAEFVWHFAGPQNLSFKQEIDLVKLQFSITKELCKAKDAFARVMLLEILGRICLKLGQQMPDVKLLGQNIDQKELPLS
ncbi:MAG: hypothetical protein KAV87_20985 [Desulfobacteraceae bacterium]|nr:hypothetical protein [Desulfobacteraceae bacterium]